MEGRLADALAVSGWAVVEGRARMDVRLVTKITAGLRRAVWRVSEQAVAELMRELGLAARRKKTRKSMTPGNGTSGQDQLSQGDRLSGKPVTC